MGAGTRSTLNPTLAARPESAARRPVKIAGAPSHQPRPPAVWRWSRAWPLPAMLAWGLAWALYAAMLVIQAPPLLAFGAACALGASLAVLAGTRWRRRLVATGFPLSVLAVTLSGALPGWIWLLPLALLALLYPLRSWRDAPLFPTPAGALSGLSQAAPLAPGARIVDLGCGVGDGLRELRREYAQAEIAGIEWSWPLRWVCGLRCGDASVSRGDIWAADWSGYDLVYLFQRPESMARAAARAQSELRPGAWLVSLEFEIVGLRPQCVLEGADRRPVWLYLAPLQRTASNRG